MLGAASQEDKPRHISSFQASISVLFAGVLWAKGIHIVMPKSAAPWTVAHLCPWNFPGKNMEWVAIPFSRGSSWSRDQTCVSYVSCIKADSLPLSHLGSLLIYPTEALPVAFCPSLEKQSKIKRSKIQSFGGAHSSHGSITILNSSPAHHVRTPYSKERSVACWGSNSATPPLHPQLLPSPLFSAASVSTLWSFFLQKKWPVFAARQISPPTCCW